MSPPDLALDLRIRYLETLLTRPSTTTVSPVSASASASTASLSRRVSQLASSLDVVLEAGPGTDALRKFVANYDLNEPLLTVPPVPFHHPSSSSSPRHDDILTPQAKVSLILEAEYEIRQLEWELRQIALLDDQGVVGAGELPQHQELRSELVQTKQEVRPVAATYQSLEHKTHDLLTRYNDYISTLSQVFVQWNDIISEAEEEVTKIEKSRNPSLDIS